MACFICGLDLKHSPSNRKDEGKEERELLLFFVRIVLNVAPVDFSNDKFQCDYNPKWWTTCNMCKDEVELAKMTYKHLIGASKKFAACQEDFLRIIKASKSKNREENNSPDSSPEKCLGRIVLKREWNGSQFQVPDLESLSFPVKTEPTLCDPSTSPAFSSPPCSPVSTSMDQDEVSAGLVNEESLPPPPAPAPPRKAGPKKVTKYEPIFLSLQKDPTTRRFKCPLCDVTHLRKFPLYVHYKATHFNEKILTCTWPDCNQSFISRETLNVHMDRHKGTPRFKCPLCDLSFYHPVDRIVHRQRDHEGGKTERKFICDLCQHTFMDSHNLRVHRQKTHRITATKKSTNSLQKALPSLEKPLKAPKKPKIRHDYGEVLNPIEKVDGVYHCPSCDYTASAKGYLFIHYQSKHLMITLPCPFPSCDKRFVSESTLRPHLDRHNNTPRFKCDLCPGLFYTSFARTFHKQEAHEDCRSGLPFVCDECGKAFPFKHNLTCHRRWVHLGIKRKDRRIRKIMKICPVCGVSVESRSLAAHIKLKHEEKQIFCSQCPATFTFERNLKLHMHSKHGSGTMQRCDVPLCRRYFETEDELNDHVDKVHGADKTKPGEWKCKYCDKAYFRKSHLTSHEALHENKETRPIICELCQKGFPSDNHLRLHLQRAHKLKKEEWSQVLARLKSKK